MNFATYVSVIRHHFLKGLLFALVFVVFPIDTSAQDTVEASDLDGIWTRGNREYEFRALPDGIVRFRQLFGKGLWYQGKFDDAGFYVTRSFSFDKDFVGGDAPPMRAKRQMLAKHPEFVWKKEFRSITKYSMEYISSGYRIRWDRSNGTFTKLEQLPKRRFTLRKVISDCSASAENVKKIVAEVYGSSGSVLVLGPDQPLPKGTIIFENNFSEDEVLRTDRPSCFYYIDLYPNAMHGHRVIYFLSDAESGMGIQRKFASNPPLIANPEVNGGKPVAYYETIEDRITSKDRVFPDTPEVRGPIVNTSFRRLSGNSAGALDQTFIDYRDDSNGENSSGFIGNRSNESQICVRTRKVALLINGGKDVAFGKNIRFMTDNFRTLDFHEIKVLSWNTHSIAEVRRSITDHSKNLTKCDIFVVYVSAHSVPYSNEDKPGGKVDMGTFNTDGEMKFHQPSKVKGEYKGFPISISNKKANFTRAIETQDWNSGSGLLYMLRTAKAGLIQVVIDMCNSALLIDATTGMDGAWGGPEISRSLSKNQRLSIITAAKSDELATFQLNEDSDFRFDGNSTGIGGLFTQTFSTTLSEMMQRVDRNNDGIVDADEYLAATTAAVKKTVPYFDARADLGAQHPQWALIQGTGNW